jgi:hypothetical protein
MKIIGILLDLGLIIAGTFAWLVSALSLFCVFKGDAKVLYGNNRFHMVLAMVIDVSAVIIIPLLMMGITSLWFK